MTPEQLIAERYRLEKEIGRGGMAEVWCAHDLRLDRRVALKLMAPALADDPGFLVRFFSEAQSVAQLNDPHVVQVLDFGDVDGRPFLVMELVEGGSVEDLTGSPLPPEEGVALVAQAAHGAGRAHSAGIVHRDIKPGNILVSEQGAKLGDFGIASSTASENLTATGAALGSPHYMSPEQATGIAATPRSDVYSLGVVLYELLTGVRPFEAPNLTAVAIAHVDREPAPPSTHAPGLDPALQAIVLRCLAKDPALRYGDGNELAAALEGYLSGAAGWPAAAATGAAGRPGLRAAAVAALALVVLAGGAALVAAATDEPDRQADGSRPLDVRRLKVETASPSPSLGAAVEVDEDVPTPAASEPSPTPEETAEEGGGKGEKRDRDEPRDSEPDPEPTPTQDPEPSEEPQAEPTPQPSEAS